MQKAVTLFFLSIIICTYGQEKDIQFLEKTISRLNKIEKISYTLTKESMEKGPVYFTSKAEIFFDFRDTRKGETPKYYIKSEKDEGGELIYDGKKHTNTLPKEKTILTDGAINPNNPIMLSLFTIKALLPQLLNHENIEISKKEDVFLDGQENYQFEISLENGVIDWEKLTINTFDNKKITYNNYYIIISKTDYLPRKITMPNGDTGTLSSTFENLNFEREIDNKIWTGELLPREYSRITFADYFRQIREKIETTRKKLTTETTNQNIYDWKLPDLKNEELIDFSSFEGKVILLEFWFKYCGPCVKAVHELNDIQEKYSKDNFLLYAIEFYEKFPREDLQTYASKINMEYPVLYKGKQLADKYSVQAAPTIMIIDKKGTIVYLESGFNKEKIEKIVKEHL